MDIIFVDSEKHRIFWLAEPFNDSSFIRTGTDRKYYPSIGFGGIEERKKKIIDCMLLLHTY